MRPHHLLLAVLGVVVGVGAVFALREATLSTHQRVPRDSQATLVLEARTKGGEPGQSLDEMVRAIVLTCRLEVGRSDPANMRHEGDGRYRITFTPGMDQTNTRQLRGCLQDWMVDHVRIDVVELRGT